MRLALHMHTAYVVPCNPQPLVCPTGPVQHCLRPDDGHCLT